MFAAVFPFIVLSGIVIKPTEGFCVETGLRDEGAPPITPEEAENEYFRPPELASLRLVRLNDWLVLPVCIRSQRGEHRVWNREGDLRLLGEQGLARLSETDPNARVLRVLTQASFAERFPVAVTLTRSAVADEVRASWLAEEAPSLPVDGGRSSAAASPLVKSSRAQVSTEEAERLWRLALRSRSVDRPMIDGNVVVIEIVDRGRRRVRTSDLHGGLATELLCGLVTGAGAPAEALENGHVAYVCDPAVEPVER